MVSIFNSWELFFVVTLVSNCLVFILSSYCSKITIDRICIYREVQISQTWGWLTFLVQVLRKFQLKKTNKQTNEEKYS